MSARTPVAAVRIGREEALVVCDDGAVFYTDAQGQGWQEWDPIPGSETDEIRKRDKWAAEFDRRYGREGATLAPDYADLFRALYRLHKGDAITAHDEAVTIEREEKATPYLRDYFGMIAQVLRREGWPEFVQKGSGLGAASQAPP